MMETDKLLAHHKGGDYAQMPVAFCWVFYNTPWMIAEPHRCMCTNLGQRTLDVSVNGKEFDSLLVDCIVCKQ